jgi:hypothetical protein
MNVFVLCTGRCGSTTFAKACGHIANYTVAHESRLSTLGAGRLAYPDRHIEIDNRLAWFLGRLDRRYGDGAFYVHLTRDREATARSYAGRTGLGFILHAYARGIYVGLPDELEWVEAAGDFCDTVNANVELFLKDKTRTLAFPLDRAKERFCEFWERIGAEGDLEAALAEWDIRCNASGSDDGSGVMYGLPAEYLDQMARRIPGEPDGWLAVGRFEDTARHLKHLRREFQGQPELNFTLAAAIVHIRRREEPGRNLALFWQLLAHPVTGRFLAEHLSLRWLVSVADTLADHAAPADAAAALILVTLANLVKLAETERRLVRDPTYDEAALETLCEQFAVPLFGGLTLYNPRRGDMPRNLFARIGRQMARQPFLDTAYRRLMKELKENPNVLSRLAGYREGFWE